jgi:lipopolysaccharide/colanic/teichoic acid biosynthesis glycosyltransferase
MYSSYIKSMFDLIAAIVLIFALLPLFIVVTIMLWIANDGKPFFTQDRPGKLAKIFKVIKFRTMNDRRDSMGKLLSDDIRLTKIGKFIRKTSLDEIPQLLNVLKGDMSLVGPRPLLPEYLPLYNKFQSRRHDVKPGITGWAQVNGRNSIGWNQKFELDVWYVDNISLKLDLLIVLKTIVKVIRSSDIQQEGKATVEYFKGNG